MTEPIVVSFSELDTHRQCAFKHQLSYVERWSQPQAPGTALSRGTLWHAVMEDHYREKQALDKLEGKAPGQRSLEDEYLLLRSRHLTDDGGEWRNEDCELVDWMLDGYLCYWGWDEDWRILAVEVGAVVPLPKATARPFAIKLKIDIVVRELSSKKLWVVDHKSGRDLPREKDLDIADQFKIYNWALRQSGHKVFGQMHSAARTYRLKTKEQPLEERFSRTRLYSTDKELDMVAHEAALEAERAWRGREAGQAVNSGILDAYPDDPPRSPDEDRCGWRCSFTEACMFGRRTGDNRKTRLMLRDQGFAQDFRRH